MSLIAISSLSLLARRAALDMLSARYRQASIIQLDAEASPETGVTITSRTFSPASEGHPDRSPQVKTNIYPDQECTSCTTFSYLANHLSSDQETILALPVGVSLANVIGLTQKTAQFTIKSCALAIASQDLEDDLWSSHSLSSIGLVGSCSDERTPGEYLVTEMAHADTIISIHNSLTGSPESVERAEDLLSHLAPHAHLVTSSNPTFSCAQYRVQEVRQRLAPGQLGTCSQDVQQAAQSDKECSHHHGPNFTTAVLTCDTIIDTRALAQHLPSIVEGACRVRGHIWLTDHPNERVAIEGIGPTVWLQTCGRWEKDLPPKTIIVVTGDDLVPEQLQAILNLCALNTEALSQQLIESSSQPPG
ncbi:GTP-binding protein [Rothia nasisuis]|uniref:GTP-binding protein n=1 Tax=Rothia nasisuis TaxID=2109647 RepID=UPI001F3EB28D|nr:GTP-binding protein [Rothia nasisuis]